MTSTTLLTFFRRLAPMALGALLLAPQLATAALSISQTPLFITISMPPNITVLLDDSGSMAWGHVPDALGENGNGTVFVPGQAATQTPTVTGHMTVISTCTRTSHGVCTRYSYSCPSGSVLNGPNTGTTSPPTGTTCDIQTITYSCPAGDTSHGSGSSMTCDGYLTFSSNELYIPDTLHYKSSAFNPLYYDPTISYLPGYSTSGTLLSTSFSAAYCNPYNTGAGTVNLGTNYQATVDFDPSTSSCSTFMGATDSEDTDPGQNEVDSCDYFNTDGTCHSPYGNASAAYYYKYVYTNTGCSGTASVPAYTDDRCYTKVIVSANSGPGSTDERQNFANWWSFYRTRNLTTNTSANRAFSTISGNIRIAWRDLNTCTAFNTTTCAGWGSGIYDNRIDAFSGTHKTTFFNWLAHFPAHNGTPLRSGLISIGAYYQTSGVDSPYAFTPHVTDSPEYVCRPNYAVIMTDGLWNSDSITTYGNSDNTAITLPDTTTYPPTATGTSSHPYSDSSSNSLADIAFYYWAHSLRSDLGTSSSLQYMPFTKNLSITDNKGNTANLIPYWNPQNDPASWPHMVTFTVGLGMTSTITSPAWGGSTYAGNANGYNNTVTNNIAWPAVSSNSTNNVYDLWHAAIDSRGQFFSADTPQDVAQAFNSIVSRIQGRVGSSSAIAVNSTRLDSNTFIYQAQFNSANWTGEVLAFKISSNGNVGTQQWQASTQIPAFGSRKIFTWDETANSGAGGGINFQWSSLNTAEQNLLNLNLSAVNDGNGSLRASYFQGDQTHEQSQAGIFRTRSPTVLGDIVDSNPQYVGTEDFGFNTAGIPEGSSYGAFLATKPSRIPMLYVGANDGMMHGFNAKTGVEVFNYVPRGVYPNLSALTDPLYVHQFYVDGSPVSVDAYVGGAWKSLLVGTTGAGAKEVYLLDVTDPSTVSTSSVLWDYDGVDGLATADPDIGFTINEPTIVRMHDGNWYALFGNGYNSTNQKAVIYLYNINTKTLYKFSTGVGSAGTPNGMSSPNPVDFDADRVTDAIYAGDLLGNIWKLDVSSSNPSNWKFFTYGNGSTPTPLFTAKDSNNNVQPITDRPQVGLNANEQVMVFFGTGTYFLTGDNTVGSNPPVQSFYGIIDDKGNTSTDTVTRSNLEQQQILAEKSQNGVNFRITTSNPVSSSQQGWYLDLLSPPLPGTANGERVVSDAVLDDGRVVFTTLIPQGNACQFGGISWLMEIDATTGSQLTASPFDTNGDGQVNNNDFITVTYTDQHGNTVTKSVPVSGQQSTVGIIKTPGIISAGQLQYKYYSGSTGAIGMTTESGNTNSQRLSWQQLQ